MTDKTYYVYLHRRADECTPFYVGCATKQTRRRGKDKYQRAYDFGQRSDAWFITRQQHGIVVEIVEEFASRDDAFTAEKHLIKKFRETLVNISTGGAGAAGIKDPEHVRMKKSVTKLGSKNPMHGKCGSRHPNSRPVIHIQTGMFFESVTEAANWCGVKLGTLYNMLVGTSQNKTPLRLA